VAGERLMDAINWSVIFLIAMPYTILFSVLGFFLYAYRRAAKKARAEERRAEELPILNPASDLS
jgi:cbb3-type cytochrome oxidase subunit 3